MANTADLLTLQARAVRHACWWLHAPPCWRSRCGLQQSTRVSSALGAGGDSVLGPRLAAALGSYARTTEPFCGRLRRPGCRCCALRSVPCLLSTAELH